MKTSVRTNTNDLPTIPSLFEDFFLRDVLESSRSNWRTNGASMPAVNIAETNDAFTIEVAAPGMKREDFNVELDNRVLTISARVEGRQDMNHNGGGMYSRKEFSYQSFQRSFELPEDKVDGEKISAKYKDGILHITVPKKEEAKVKPPKQISVS